ncbi:hypothetical protein L1987_51373 [Smallanthus sonchifolius]|uniref:Uncharacterized protein n=1 Tax=Smallanthus sonchifolius TaxID=185202 RepID=A0ACB9EQ34_9ASTR|nr:hypothetical protein L1987_51373 [Smallanthus sonchifolius]
MDVWSGMGPQTPEYEKWGQRLRETCKDKHFPESNDQTGLVYLLLKEKEKWGDKVYVEDGYYFEGLRRRHAEKMREGYNSVGTHNELYSRQGCWDAMQKVLNFGDNQVLRSCGFVHPSLGDSGSVMPVPFDYPA